MAEPDERVYVPRHSWAPVFLAAGIAALVCGAFASGFIFNPFIYAIIGALIAIAAFSAIVRAATADYFRLPRKQRSRSAALPIETITVPRRRG